MAVKTYNDGGVTLRQAFEIAKSEAIAGNRSVMFQFALVKLVVGPEPDCTFEFIEEEFRKAVGGIKYVVKQL
jgi:hypothetical protein